MKATDLKINKKARIIKMNCPIKVKRRLFQMGIYEQALIEVVQIAPLEDPIIFKVGQSRIALRKKIANQIEVSEHE